MKLIQSTRRCGLAGGVVVGLAVLISSPSTVLAHGNMSGGSMPACPHNGGTTNHQGGGSHSGTAGVGPNKIGLAIPAVLNGLTYVNLLDDPDGTPYQPKTNTPNYPPSAIPLPEPMPPGYTPPAPPVDPAELQRKLNSLEAQNKRLEQRLQALEGRLTGSPTPPDPTAARVTQKLQQVQNRNNQPQNLTPGWKWNPMDR